MTDEDRQEIKETKINFEAMADMVEEMKSHEKNEVDERNMEFDNQAIA